MVAGRRVDPRRNRVGDIVPTPMVAPRSSGVSSACQVAFWTSHGTQEARSGTPGTDISIAAVTATLSGPHIARHPARISVIASAGSEPASQSVGEPASSSARATAR